MANKKRAKQDYPIVKYRIVTGNGYYLVDGNKDALKKALEAREKFVLDYCHDEESKKRFSTQYIVKVTEEYIEPNEI